MICIFDPEMLGAAEGVSKIARGNADKDTLKDMKANGWSEPNNLTVFPYMDDPYEPRAENWMEDDNPRIFTGQHGYAYLRSSCCYRDPMDSFFAPPRMWGDTAAEGNEYFQENQH
ncbi:hypothetical protein GN244_ATG07457 [Phytophthora infestans]|uniref:Uncharacterized protein n=1 Tax=Phytophthora infestans TaxID=4787 RepID=A0A833SXI2_PHYIN|nr:hypothetical protein GN244_ATG07457 [Phytophthora infestans]